MAENVHVSVLWGAVALSCMKSVVLSPLGIVVLGCLIGSLCPR